MGLIGEADLLAMIESVGGVLATIAGQEIRGIFEEPYIAFDTATGLPIVSDSPTLLMRTSDLPNGSAEGTSVVVSGSDYTIAGAPQAQDDGSVTLLRLRHA